MNYCLHKIVAIVAFTFLTSSDKVWSQNIDSLQQVRTIQLAANESTRDTDKLLHAAGKAPEAIIDQVNPQTISFPTYLGNDNAQREQKLNLRLKAHYPYITSILFNSDYSVVTIQGNVIFTASMINELVAHFGYIGYAVK